MTAVTAEPAARESAGRAKRAAAVEILCGRIRGASGLVFLNAQALNAAETSALRAAMRPTEASLVVVKNRLMKIACARESVTDCDAWLRQNTAVAFLGPDAVAAVKALSTFAAEHDKLVIKGGVIDGKPVGPADLKALAALPGRRDLLTMTAAGLKAPLARAARDFRAVLTKLVLLVAEAAKKAPKD
jgi:large subunit ribosomal protein L10